LICANSTSELFNQFTGIMIGNPLLGCDSVWATSRYVAIQFNTLYWRGLISYQHLSNCTTQNCDASPAQSICASILNDAIGEIGVIYQQLMEDESMEVTGVVPHFDDQPLPSLDPDNLYQDFCSGNGSLQFSAGVPDTCFPLGNALTAYLNQANVQTAINAKSVQWSVCSPTLNYSESGASMMPLFRQFLSDKPTLKVLVYSGDIDVLTIPFGYTQQCLSELNSQVTSRWEPWFVNAWTAGYWEVHQQFTYATVKGAGHEAPEYQPLNSLAMFSRFLQNGHLRDGKMASDTNKQRKPGSWRASGRQADVLRSFKNLRPSWAAWELPSN